MAKQIITKTPEQLGFDVHTKGIYSMCETQWAKAMLGEYQLTGKYTLQFGVGDTTSATMIERFGTLSSSKNLQEQKFFIDAIPNPGYRDHDLHRIIRETFAYQVSASKDKREVFATVVSKALAEEFIKTSDFEPIRQWLSDQIRRCNAKLNTDHRKLSVKLRDIQEKVLKKIVKTILRNGINSNIIAELAPRLGKTILFLMMAKEFKKQKFHKSMFVLAYGVGLSVKASYKEEIAKFQDFKDFVFIDNANDNAQNQYKNAIADGKFPVVFVSLNAKLGTEEKEERLDWIKKTKEDCIALLEETDFGNHTESQVKKTQQIFSNKNVTQINASGTNIGRIAKASGDNPADEIIRVPYCMVEQDGSIPNVVKRKFYNMVFNAMKMNRLLKGFEKDLLPNINKILADAIVQKQFLTALFQDIFDYQPRFGLSLTRQAKESIDNVMLFTTITKSQMKNLAKVIEEACKYHKVLVLNGDETSNKESQSRTYEELVALKNGKYGERNKLIVITNMMGTRSYTVPEIQACLFMMEGGDIYPYMQRYSRCLSPDNLGIKKYGHIFDFSFDQTKTRNTEMSIAIEAAAVMEQKNISFPDAIREVMFSVNLSDMLSGDWSANDIIKHFENNDKLVEVANALSRVSVEDFNDVDLPGLVELAKRSMSKEQKSNFNKVIKTGKTFESKKKRTQKEEDEYQKLLKSMKKTIERAIRALNSSASTVTEICNYEGKTYEQCLTLISKNKQIANEFIEMFGVDVNFVNSIKDKLPLPTLDLIVEGTIRGNSANNVVNSSLGIVADSPELWKEILGTRAIRRAVNSNKCKRILVVAGGLGTEIDVLIELYGVDILSKIVYNDKYTSFCNRIKRKYPKITVLQGDFLELEIDMKFDVIVGNYPYADADDSGGALWGKFADKVFDLLKPNGTSAAIHPPSFIGKHLNKGTGKSDYTVFKENQINEIHLFDDTEKNKYFSGVGTKICWYIATKTSPTSLTKIIGYDNGNTHHFDVDFTKQGILPQVINPISMSIHNKIISKRSLEFIQTRELHYHTMKKRDQVSEEINAEYPYKSYFSHAITRASNFKMRDYENVKVMIPQTSTIDNSFIDKNCNVSEDLFYIKSDSLEAPKILEYLQSDLVSYIGKNYRPGRNLGSLLSAGIIPIKDSVISFTKEERNYIESFIEANS